MQWLIFTWGLYLVPATILGAPVWFFGRKRVKWMWIDFMVLVLPYGICATIPPGLNNIAILYTALFSALAAPIAPLIRVIVRARINEYRTSIYSVSLVCGITLIICMLGPGFIYVK